MAAFLDPFSGVIPERKLTLRELTRALRMALSAEEEAVHLYESLADSTTSDLAREVLQDIADEEKVHVGEFQRLISILLKDEDQWLANGAAEVDEMAAKVAGKGAGKEAENTIKSIGSMKE